MSTELEQAINEFMTQQESAKQLPQDQWRLYYNEVGFLVDTVCGPPWPESEHAFIDITKSQLTECSAYRQLVKNGQFIPLDRVGRSVVKLQEDANGEYLTVADNMAVILEPGEEHSNVTKYSKNTN